MLKPAKKLLCKIFLHLRSKTYSNYLIILTDFYVMDNSLHNYTTDIPNTVMNCRIYTLYGIIGQTQIDSLKHN